MKTRGVSDETDAKHTTIYLFSNLAQTSLGCGSRVQIRNP
jgi:hypothetical protein